MNLQANPCPAIHKKCEIKPIETTRNGRRIYEKSNQTNSHGYRDEEEEEQIGEEEEAGW